MRTYTTYTFPGDKETGTDSEINSGLLVIAGEQVMFAACVTAWPGIEKLPA
jgi:hypothetical protein